MAGYSLDLDTTKPTDVSLFSGQYVVKIFNRNLATGKRTSFTIPFVSNKLSILNPIEIPTYIHEKPFKQWQKQFEKNINSKVPRKLY